MFSRRPLGIRSSPSSSAASWCGRTRGRQPAALCACRRACASCSAAAWAGCRQRQLALFSTLPRWHVRRSTSSRLHTETGRTLSRRSTRLCGRAWSSSRTGPFASRTLACLDLLRAAPRSMRRSSAPRYSHGAGHGRRRSAPGISRSLPRASDASCRLRAGRGRQREAAARGNMAAAELCELGCRADAARPLGATAAYASGSTSVASPATVNGRWRYSRNSSSRSLSGVERADVLVASSSRRSEARPGGENIELCRGGAR